MRSLAIILVAALAQCRGEDVAKAVAPAPAPAPGPAGPVKRQYEQAVAFPQPVAPLGPAAFAQPGLRYTQQPINYARQNLHYAQQPFHFAQQPLHYAHGDLRYTQQPLPYSQGNLRYTQQPLHYTQGDLRYTQRPIHFAQQPVEYYQQQGYHQAGVHQPVARLRPAVHQGAQILAPQPQILPQPAPKIAQAQIPAGRVGPHIAILRSASDVNFDGNFFYDYETENGISARAEGTVKSLGPEETANVMSGSYTYISPEGTPITTHWVADEFGFRAEGDHIPKAPEAVARAVEYVRSQPQPAALHPVHPQQRQ